jgi:hypothetical protein
VRERDREEGRKEGGREGERGERERKKEERGEGGKGRERKKEERKGGREGGGITRDVDQHRLHDIGQMMDLLVPLPILLSLAYLVGEEERIIESE